MLKNYRKDRCYIIAEIGGNFTTLDEAKKLIDQALDCKVDAVKLQTYKAETIASKNAMFDMENTGVVSQYELFKKYEIDENLHAKIFSYARGKGLDLFSTPSHETDVALLERLGVEAYKIGSDDAVNIPFLKFIAQKKKPIILSTGMCTLEEVRASVSEILAEGNDALILLHAVTSYPTHPQHVNLSTMQTLMREFPQLDVGYSDHTLGTTACLCAAAMGARVIEKHFTFNKAAEGPDHMLSADPAELREIVDNIREFEVMKGNGIKRPADSEKNTRINNRKSVVMNKALKKGEVIARECIAIKRPGYGIEPKFFEEIIGRSAKRDLVADEVLKWEDI